MNNEQLRMIVLDLRAHRKRVKWGCPSYSDSKKNIVLIHGFKDYSCLLFFKGALLKDAKAHPHSANKKWGNRPASTVSPM